MNVTSDSECAAYIRTAYLREKEGKYSQLKQVAYTDFLNRLFENDRTFLKRLLDILHYLWPGHFSTKTDDE